jgi:DNA polymerase I-like protein with 3'-5' exonuclease and polymerase domains
LQTRGPGAHREGCFIAGIAVGTEAGFRGYYPIAHEAGENLPKVKVLAWLKEQMALPVPKVGAHLLYDLAFLSAVGIEPVGPFYDIQNAEPLLSETRLSYNLEALSKHYLGIGKIDEELDDYLIQHFGRKNPKSNIWRAPGDVVAKYAIGDVNHPLEIFKRQKPELEKQDLWDLFVLESKLIPMLLAMRQRGVRVDLDRAEKLLADLTVKQAEVEAEIKRQTGITPQIWAAENLSKIFDQAGIEYPLTPKTKKPSFTAPWLNANASPIAKMIVDARKMDKMRGTFLRGCILEGHTKGRVHCQFNQLKSDDGGAVSGRFSSSNPNLQFIPVRTANGKEMRKMFLPDEGQDWYKFDYSQIEFRLVVHDALRLDLPGADEVAHEYRNNPDADFHQAVADMAGIDRSFAKTINFGLIYGEGVQKLCQQLGMEVSEGRRFLEQYHKRVPFVRPLAQGYSRMAANEGEVVTELKRRRRFPWMTERNGKAFFTDHRIPGSKRAFTHKALNARIQGSAADVIKKAMVDVWESGVIDEIGVPQLTVHDELDGSSPRTARAKKAMREMKELLEHTLPFFVPLKVDGGTGPNWGEA